MEDSGSALNSVSFTESQVYSNLRKEEKRRERGKLGKLGKEGTGRKEKEGKRYHLIYNLRWSPF